MVMMMSWGGEFVTYMEVVVMMMIIMKFHCLGLVTWYVTVDWSSTVHLVHGVD